MCWKWWNVGAICLFSSQMIWHIFPKRTSLINRIGGIFFIVNSAFFSSLFLVVDTCFLFSRVSVSYLLLSLDLFRLSVFLSCNATAANFFFYSFVFVLGYFWKFFGRVYYNIIVLKLIWCMRLTRLGVKIPKSNVLLLNLETFGPFYI